MSGMGEGGPWSDFVTYAPTIHALSGLTISTGVPGREDIGLGFSYTITKPVCMALLPSWQPWKAGGSMGKANGLTFLNSK